MKSLGAARLAISVVAAVVAGPLSAQFAPVREYSDPSYQALTGEQAIAACDQYASHPLDPMKPDGVKGVSNDADVDVLSAYLYCHKALQADLKNPRIKFQWGRANQLYNPTSGAQPRQMYKMAYRDGSEIAGIYLAKLPPERRMSLDAMIAQMESMKGPQGQPRPMTGAERDELLLGSVFVIGSVALLRILNGEAEWPSGECSGGYAINAATHEVVCNGLVVGAF
ncbi:MAG: hypothetical protein AAGI28_06610 [Pseudomonadota bacterium]